MSVLITGANRGIGRALVEILSKSGFDIVATTRTIIPEFIDWSKDLESRVGNKIINETLDLNVAKDAGLQMARILKKNQNIVHLINNAAVPFGAHVLLTPLSSLKKVYEINLFSQFSISQVFAKHLMRKREGSITNISSITAVHPIPGSFVYGSSKIALEYLTRTLALELKHFNICVTAVELGLVETDMLNEMDQHSQDLIKSNFAQISRLKPGIVAESFLQYFTSLNIDKSGQVVKLLDESAL
jgi:3-oxoacyl-[acyl-carrier protein] reductase